MWSEFNNMTEVIFTKYNFRIETRDNRQVIFDIIRKKMVALTPEEWVRQHVILYLHFNKVVPKGLIAVERAIELNGLKKRFDIVVFNRYGTPKMIIECKAPEEKLNDKVFEQIARYNLALKVDYLWLTNGEKNYCCKLRNGIELLTVFPAKEELLR